MKITYNILYTLLIYFIGIFLIHKNLLTEFYILAFSYFIALIIYLIRSTDKKKIYNILLVLLFVILLPKYQYDYELELFVKVLKINHFENLSSLIDSYILKYFSIVIIIFFLERIYHWQYHKVFLVYLVGYLLSILLLKIDYFLDLFKDLIHYKSSSFTTVLFILQLFMSLLLVSLCSLLQKKYNSRI